MTPEELMERLRLNLDLYRKHRGFKTWKALATAARVDASSLSKMKNGHEGAAIGRLAHLAEALDCEPGELLADPKVTLDRLKAKKADSADGR